MVVIPQGHCKRGSTSEQEIVDKTSEALEPLTTAFGGYELDRELIQQKVGWLLQRRQNRQEQ